MNLQRGGGAFASSANSKNLCLRILLLSVHQPVDISVAPDEVLVAIWSQNEWICASEDDADKISPSDCRYSATHQSIFYDKET